MAIPLTAKAVGLARLRASDRAVTRVTRMAAARRAIAVPSITAPQAGYERAAATRPVAELTTPTESTLFAAPDGSVQYYLPRYQLKRVGTSRDRYDIAIADAVDVGFRIIVGLERTPPPEAAATPGAEELSHDVLVRIDYTTANGLQFQAPLSDLLLDDGGKVVGAAGPLSLLERDRLLGAIKGDGSARLIISRTIHVAVRQPPVDAPAGPPLILAADLQPQFLEVATPRAVAVGHEARAFHTLGKRNVGRFRPGFETVLVGGVAAEAVPAPPPPPPAPASLYQDADLVFDQAAEPDPLKLDETLHAYFYEGTSRSLPTDRPLKRISVAFREGQADRRQVYFQDNADQSLFYYLPDAFRLGRDDDEPFTPAMVVRMSKPEGSSSVLATVDYIARPFTLPHSLEEAIPTLRESMPPSLTSQGAEPKLMPLPAVGRLKLHLPTPSGVELRSFEDVSVRIDNGFHHSLTVPIEQFRELFAAAFSTDATSLFAGEAEVTGMGGSPVSVPVEIRFNLTEGPLFDSTESRGPTGVVNVTLKNATESPLRIRNLQARLLGPSTDVEARIGGLDFSQPVELAPAAAVQFLVVPEGAIDSADVRPVLDLAAVDILAQPEAVLKVISGTAVAPEIARPIEVTTVPELWDDGSPDGPIVLIIVDFKSGGSVSLKPDTPVPVRTTVPMPLGNLLLGQDTRGTFEYRQQIIRRSGKRTNDEQWRQSDSGVLVVPVGG